MKRIAFVAVLAAIMVVGLAGVASAQPVFGSDLGFYDETGVLACQACHTDLYASWAQSKHFAAEDEYPIPRGGNCASCHTTNYEPANDVIDDGQPLAEATYPGQTCEACHGPGHWSAPGGNTVTNPIDGSTINPGFDVTVADVRDSQTCGQCHSRHNENLMFLPEANVEYAIGYLPGLELTDFVEIPAPVGFPGFRSEPAQPEGFEPEDFWTDYPSWSNYSHGGSAMQYQEFRQSEHGDVGMECVTCHTVHDPGVDPGLPTLDDPEVPGVEGHAMLRDVDAKPEYEALGPDYALCSTCHEGSNLTVGSTPSMPQVSMLNGAGGVGVPNLPHVHASYCTDCHMVPTGYAHNGNAGMGGNHLWQIVEPVEAATYTTHVEGVVHYEVDGVELEAEQEIEVHMPMSSCSACHGNLESPMSVALETDPTITGTVDLAAKGIYEPVLRLQPVIDSRQTQVASELEDLDALLAANASGLTAEEQELWDMAEYNVNFVKADGSLGFHNFQYAINLLFQAREWLTQIDGEVPPVDGFTDVTPALPSDFYLAITTLADMGIVQGFGDGTFRPFDNVKRAQFTKMIVEVLGLHTMTIENTDNPTFPDVTTIAEYPYDYVEEAAAADIVQGFNDGTFRPFVDITRAQLAVMIVRATAGMDLLPDDPGTTSFTDIGTVDAEMQAAIRILTEAGVIQGRTSTTFAPFDSATRAQTAAIMYRFWTNFLQ